MHSMSPGNMYNEYFFPAMKSTVNLIAGLRLWALEVGHCRQIGINAVELNTP